MNNGKVRKLAAVIVCLLIVISGCGKAENKTAEAGQNDIGLEGDYQNKKIPDNGKGTQTDDLKQNGTTQETDKTGSDSENEVYLENTSIEKEKGWNDLNQKEITQAMGAGWNLGNQLEAATNGLPGETKWGNPVITEELILAVKEAGFQSIRIPVSYLGYIGGAPNYTISSQWLDRVEEVVNYCIKNGLYVIINLHGDGYYTIDGGWLLCAEQNQDEIQAKYEACWRQIAERFRSYDEHLIFESMNEVFDGKYNGPSAQAYANINEYNRIFVDTVRQSGGYNNRRWLLIPGWNTDIEYTAGEYGFVIPEDLYLAEELNGEKRLMISVHYYAPWDFCGSESGEITQWGDSAEDSSKTSVYSGQGVLAAQMKRLNEVFVEKGYPVVIGEYGSIDKSEFDEKNTYYRAYFARKVCENSKQNGCIPVYWDNGHNGRFGFALFNRRTKEVTQSEIISAIMQVYRPVQQDGTAQKISIEPAELTLCVGDSPVLLNAAVLPEGCTDPVRWKSSDESIITVSDSGEVRAQKAGKAQIYASTPNGIEAVCQISVVETNDIRLRLYAVETASWSTISSEHEIRFGSDGGTYTITLSGSKEFLSNIGSLYFKDVQVQSGSSAVSQLQSAKITLNSVRFNGKECELTGGNKEEGVNAQNKAFDYCLLNQWAAGSEKIGNVQIGETGSYEFTGIPYEDINTIEVTFTITDVILP